MNETKALSETVTQLERDVLARIPLAAAMCIHVSDYVPSERLVLAAPLEPNLNHEGIGFGGAIECLGTLACWGLVWLTLDDPEALIVVQHCEVDFKAPIAGDLRAVARSPNVSTWQRFTNHFAKRGSARIDLTSLIGDASQPEAACFRGRFVAKRKA